MKFGLLVAIFGMALTQAPQVPQPTQYPVFSLGKQNPLIFAQNQNRGQTTPNNVQNFRLDSFNQQPQPKNQGFNPAPNQVNEVPKTPIAGQKPQDNNMRPQTTINNPTFPSFPSFSNDNTGLNQNYPWNQRSQSLDRFTMNQVFEARPRPHSSMWPPTNPRRDDIRDEGNSRVQNDWRTRSRSEDMRRNWQSGRPEEFRHSNNQMRDPRDNNRRSHSFDLNNRNYLGREVNPYFNPDRDFGYQNRGLFDGDRRRAVSNNGRRGDDRRNFWDNDFGGFKIQQTPRPFEQKNQFPNPPRPQMFAPNQPFGQQSFQRPQQRDFQPQQRDFQPQQRDFQPQQRDFQPFQQPQQREWQQPQQAQQQRPQPQPQQQQKPLKTQQMNPINDFVLQQQQQNQFQNLNKFNSNIADNQLKLSSFTDASRSNAYNLPRPVELPKSSNVNNWNSLGFGFKSMNIPKPTPQF